MKKKNKDYKSIVQKIFILIIMLVSTVIFPFIMNSINNLEGFNKYFLELSVSSIIIIGTILYAIFQKKMEFRITRAQSKKMFTSKLKIKYLPNSKTIIEFKQYLGDEFYNFLDLYKKNKMN